MTTARPQLTKQLDSGTFLQFYYLKEELDNFCREHGLSTSGGKREITKRIAHFLKTGERLEPQPSFRGTPEVIDHLSLDTIIEENFRCSERHRAFFSSIIGKKFHFSVAFQKYLKSHSGETYGDAVEAWHAIEMDRKKNKGKNVIDPQFEYNRYTREFFKHNPGKTRHDAIKCWMYKKSLPGPKVYEDADLVALHQN